ncbi:MAG: hypothetical protein Kow0079_12840 [Vicingaceae bacterium]
MKLKLILYSVIILSADLLFSQENSESQKDTSEVYEIVEKMPSFAIADDNKKDQDSLFSYLSSHLVYPQLAKDFGIQGTVFINFVVSKTGKLRDFKVLRGAHKILDDAALEVVKNMPDWIPGTQRGIPVNVAYNLPIRFYIKGKVDKKKVLNKYLKEVEKYIEKEEYDEAVQLANIILYVYPAELNALTYRGIAYYKFGSIDNACKDFESIINNNNKVYINKIIKYYNKNCKTL